MCGVFLAVKVKADFEAMDTSACVRALSSLSRRGPDNDGYTVRNLNFDSLFIGHTRLAIRDLSENGSQPMWTHCKSVCISFNGEVYGIDSFRDMLMSEGYRFRGSSDTEVLLNLYLFYERSIERVLNDIDGIFSFVVIDFEKNIIFGATDRFGVKPLFMCKSPEWIILCSEPKAIYALKKYLKMELNLNKKWVADSLTYLYSPSQDFIFKEIDSIEPGALLSYSSITGLSKKKWFSLVENYLANKANAGGEITHDELRNLIGKEVRRQSVSDVGFGLFLSGGLDSSILAREASHAGLDTIGFTINWAHEHKDEMDSDLPYARKVADRFGIPLHEVFLNDHDFFSSLLDGVRAMDTPFGDPAIISSLLLSSRASEAGVKVVLTGSGSDDLFSGYRRHRLAYLSSIIDRMGIRPVLAQVWRAVNPEKNFRKLKKTMSVLANVDSSKGLGAAHSWLGSTLVSELVGVDPTELLDELFVGDGLTAGSVVNFGLSNLDIVLLLEQRFFLSNHNLSYVDRTTMYHGVEGRVPFLAKGIVDIAAQIPVDQKFNAFNSKLVLKSCYAPILGNEICYRKKVGFGIPLRSIFNGSHLETLKSQVLDEKKFFEKLFSLEKLENLFKLQAEGRIDASYSLFCLMTYLIWKQYLSDDFGIVV